MTQIHRELRGFWPMGVGEYPDEIEGYLGCLPYYGRSSLRLWGNCIQSPLLSVAIRTVVTGPLANRGGLNER